MQQANHWREMSFFRKTDPPVLSAGDLPSGVCVFSAGEYYYINGNYKHPIPTDRVRESWSFPFVVNISEDLLAPYKKAKPLGFRDGTLVRALSDGKTYLISKRLKRIVANPDLLKAAGVTRIEFVSDKELALHADGEVIN